MIADTYYRESANGNKEWINPADVEVQRDERGRVTGRHWSPMASR